MFISQETKFLANLLGRLHEFIAPFVDDQANKIIRSSVIVDPWLGSDTNHWRQSSVLLGKC